MKEPATAHSVQTKMPRRINGNLAKVLHKLYSDLERDGYKDTLAYLPGTELMKFSKYDYDGHHSVEIYLGKAQGLVYACADGQVVRKNATTGEIISIIDEEFAKRHYSSMFQPPQPLGWNFDLKWGLRTPCAPRSLALIQFYCLSACNDQEWPDRDVPVPDYGFLCQAFDAVKADWQFNVLVNKRPDYRAMYEIPNFGVLTEYASSSSGARSQPSPSVAASETASGFIEDLFVANGPRTPEPARQTSISASRVGSNDKTHDTEPRNSLAADTNVTASSPGRGLAKLEQIRSTSSQADHAVSEGGQSIIEYIESLVLERVGRASLQRNGNNALSAIAPASAKDSRMIPSCFEVSYDIATSFPLKGEEEAHLLGIVCAPDAKALDLVRENVTEDKLAAIWTLDRHAFEQQDDTSFAMLRLSLRKAQMSVGDPRDTVFAYIGSGWNKFLRPNLTLLLETMKTRSGHTNVRFLLSKGEKTSSRASHDIEDFLKYSKATNMQELTAMIMYAFLLARESSSNEWQDNIVPIYPGFLLDLHRLGSRLLRDATAGSPGSQLAGPSRPTLFPSFKPANSASSFNPTSTSSVRRGMNRVDKPHNTGAIFISGANSPIPRRATGRKRVAEAPSHSDQLAIPNTPQTPQTPGKKSKPQDPLAPRRNAPHPTSKDERARAIFYRNKVVERRQAMLREVYRYQAQVDEADGELAKIDKNLEEIDGLDELLDQQERGEVDLNSTSS